MTLLPTVFERWRDADEPVVSYTIHVNNDMEEPECAILQAHYNRAERNVHILDVCTWRGHEGKGYATLLMQTLLANVPRDLFDSVTLDDCSDLFRHPRNLYLRLGFRYIEDGQPEMLYRLADFKH